MLRTVLWCVLIVQFLLSGTFSGRGKERVWGTVNVCFTVDKCLITFLDWSTSLVFSSKSLWTPNKYQLYIGRIKSSKPGLRPVMPAWVAEVKFLLTSGFASYRQELSSHSIHVSQLEHGNTDFRVTSKISVFHQTLNLQFDSSCVGLTALLLHLAIVRPCKIVPLVKSKLHWYFCCQWWKCSWKNCQNF